MKCPLLQEEDSGSERLAQSRLTLIRWKHLKRKQGPLPVWHLIYQTPVKIIKMIQNEAMSPQLNSRIYSVNDCTKAQCWRTANIAHLPPPFRDPNSYSPFARQNKDRRKQCQSIRRPVLIVRRLCGRWQWKGTILGSGVVSRTRLIWDRSQRRVTWTVIMVQITWWRAWTGRQKVTSHTCLSQLSKWYKNSVQRLKSKEVSSISRLSRVQKYRSQSMITIIEHMSANSTAPSRYGREIQALNSSNIHLSNATSSS